MRINKNILRRIIKEALDIYPEWEKAKQMANMWHLRDIDHTQQPAFLIGDNLIWDRTLHGCGHIGAEALKEVLSKVDFDGRLDRNGDLKQKIFFKYPIAYDELVETKPTDTIFYAKRWRRKEPSRFVIGRTPRATNVINVTLHYRGREFRRNIGKMVNKWDVITVYGGLPAAKEPWDERSSLKDAQFWLNHAFTTASGDMTNTVEPEEYWGRWGVPRREQKDLKYGNKLAESVEMSESDLRKMIAEAIEELMYDDMDEEETPLYGIGTLVYKIDSDEVADYDGMDRDNGDDFNSVQEAIDVLKSMCTYRKNSVEWDLRYANNWIPIYYIYDKNTGERIDNNLYISKLDEEYKKYFNPIGTKVIAL